MNKKQYPVRDALAAAGLLIANLSHCCHQIAVAGSLRRHLSAGNHNATVSDIEIVAVPRIEQRVVGHTLFGDETEDVNALWERIERIGYEMAPQSSGRTVWGPLYRRFYAPLPEGAGEGAIPCDLFLAHADGFGATLAIRTGPADFSKALVGFRPDFKFSNGHLYELLGGFHNVPDEQTLFDILGIPWMEPHERSVAALQRAAQSIEVAA